MSPSLEMIEQLIKEGAKVIVYDPLVTTAPKGAKKARSLNALLEGADHLILATEHNEFKALSGKRMAKSGIRSVVDGRNIWDSQEMEKVGIIYRGIGRR
jgi:UDP-N-acetyl-D-mannosaminuronate dehydrogenase